MAKWARASCLRSPTFSARPSASRPAAIWRTGSTLLRASARSVRSGRRSLPTADARRVSRDWMRSSVALVVAWMGSTTRSSATQDAAARRNDGSNVLRKAPRIPPPGVRFNSMMSPPAPDERRPLVVQTRSFIDHPSSLWWKCSALQNERFSVRSRRRTEGVSEIVRGSATKRGRKTAALGAVWLSPQAASPGRGEP